MSIQKENSVYLIKAYLGEELQCKLKTEIDCGFGGNLWRISDWNVDDEVFLSRIGGFGGYRVVRLRSFLRSWRE
jgi:hypothetical protein